MKPEKPSWMPDTQGFLAIAILMIVGFVIVLLLYKPVAVENKDILNVTLGVLLGSLKDVYSFFFGSSKGSEKKDDALISGAVSPTSTPPIVPPSQPIGVGDVATKVIAFLAVMLTGLMLMGGDARAQVRKPQITGDFSADAKANLGLSGTAGQAVTSPLANILGALDDKVLPDLQYALKMAIAADSKVTAPCYQAWIDIINKRKVAVTNADGSPVDLPQPRIITDFEKAVELRNALQPDSDFSIKCAPVVAMVKLDILSFMGKVIGGGAGLATLVPGL